MVRDSKMKPQKRVTKTRGKSGENAQIHSPEGRLLARTFTLPGAALAATPVYPRPDRLRLLDQLSLALDSFYVHLERKKAIYGFDPAMERSIAAAIRALESRSASR